MKIVILPQEVLTVGERKLTAVDLIHEIILTRPNWRKPGNVKCALSISEKLDGSPESLKCTDRELELLSEESNLQGPQGPASLSPPSLNRLFLKLVEAFYDAKDAKD